jgi:hypothetical protein
VHRHAPEERRLRAVGELERPRVLGTEPPQLAFDEPAQVRKQGPFGVDGDVRILSLS